MANLKTDEQIKEYIKKHGKFPAGRARCMDCRCTGKGECSGETIAEQNRWYQQSWS